MQTWMTGVLLAALAAAPGLAVAQQELPNEPPEGCFCLADADGQIQRGCRGQRASGQFYWRGICKYVDGDGNTVTARQGTLITEAWTVIPDGDEGCTPCEPQGRSTEDVIRGDDDEDEEP